MALRTLQLTTRAMRPGVLTSGAQSALRTRVGYPTVYSFQYVNGRRTWSLSHLQQYVASLSRTKRNASTKAGTDAEPIKSDMNPNGNTRIPPNVDQLFVREGWATLELHTNPGLTKERCEELARELEDHLNNSEKASPRVVEARPYRVCTLFVGGYAGAPSQCQIVFRFPEGEDPDLLGLPLTEDCMLLREGGVKVYC